MWTEDRKICRTPWRVWGPDKGRYTVHPVLAPCSSREEPSKRGTAGANNQKLRLFNIGKAIWGAPM